MTEPQTRPVIIKGINIPFMDLTVFMVKWALAAIPASIILWILAILVSRIFVGLGISPIEFFTW